MCMCAARVRIYVQRRTGGDRSTRDARTAKPELGEAEDEQRVEEDVEEGGGEGGAQRSARVAGASEGALEGHQRERRWKGCGACGGQVSTRRRLG
jgi:hypothetical protein